MQTATFSPVLPIVAFLLGVLAAWFFVNRISSQALRALTTRLDLTTTTLDESRNALAEERGKSAQLVADRDAARDQFSEERKTLTEGIRVGVQAAAAEAFVKERAATLDGVKSALSPVSQNLAELKANLGDLEKQRLQQAENVKTSIAGLAGIGTAMQQVMVDAKKETAILAGALKDNRVRGKWGEMTLECALERAGMVEHVSYDRQTSQGSGIPDITIHLPGGRNVPVDAKVPLNAYYEAVTATEAAEQRRLFIESANALRAKVKELFDRGYHLVENACGFSVLYVPLESVLSAALSVDPDIAEYANDRGVLLASPHTLMVQLKAFACAWALDKEQKNSAEIIRECLEMVNRMQKVGTYLDATGKALNKTVSHWNDAVGSFDSRLTTQAMKVLQLAGQHADIDERPVVETMARVPQRLDRLPASAVQPVLTVALDIEAA